MMDPAKGSISRIYLDHAATSWPKADGVLEAMHEFARIGGAAAGRGGYRSAQDAGRIVDSVRMELARLIGVDSPTSISLHPNGTSALNAAIVGLLKPGDHVVTTAAEHNSVLRVIAHLQQHSQIDWTIVDCDALGKVTAKDVIGALQKNTRLVAVTHASNVTGSVQPIAEIGQALESHPAAFLVDAAQTVGHVPIQVRQLGIDLLAAPGHKCLGGPQGTGFLFTSPDWHDQVRPSLYGGTGSSSESLAMPDVMPTKLEAGNLNVPALAGLLVATRQANDQTKMEERLHRSRQQSERLHHALRQMSGVKVYGNSGVIPIVSFGLDGMATQEVAVILDAEFGMEVRAGLHCAARIHHFLGSEPEGTIRVSAGHTTTETEIESFLDAIRQIAGS